MPEKAIEFTTVQRPGGTSLLPAALTQAIERTVTNGQAVRIDTTQWTRSRKARVYRALHAYGKTTPFTVLRRRTDDCIYAWGEKK